MTEPGDTTRTEGDPVLEKIRGLTPGQIDLFVDRIQRRIVRCGSCGEAFEVAADLPPEKATCPACTATLILDLSQGSTPPTATHVSSAEGLTFGRYRLLAELGRGGMGVVWKAWDVELKRTVALKQVLLDERQDPTLAARFAREARLAAGLAHPNIVRVLDVGTADGRRYYTAEYVEGDSLARLQRQPIDCARVVAWVRAVAEALHYAHQQGVVHRDVKPGNILIDVHGRPFVTDFGLAKCVADRDQSALSLTRSGAILGTPRYMSPEQAAGDVAAVGPASDQFSLGAVFYELLTRRHPFEETNPAALLYAILERDPVRPREIVADLPPDLETICLKALEKDPNQRYASLQAFAEDLARYVDGDPIEARPLSSVGRLLRRARKHRGRILLASAAAALLAGGVTWAIVERLRGRDIQARSRGDVEKALLATNVLLRWTPLTPTLQTMEGIFHDSTLSPEEKRRACAESWAPIDAFMRKTPPDAASQATMRALAGWARRLASREEEGLAWIRQAKTLDPDLPYGALMEALVCLSDRISAQAIPTVVYRKGELRFDPPPPESDALLALRGRSEELLAEAGRGSVWGEGIAADFRNLFLALSAVEAGHHAEADGRLERALDAPTLQWFRSGVLIARAHARFGQERFQEAAADLEEVAAVRPRQGGLRAHAGSYLVWEATKRIARKESPREPLLRAMAHLDEAIALDPANAEAWEDRGRAGAWLGDIEYEQSRDSWPWVARAVADLGEAIARGRASRSAYYMRATRLTDLAHLKMLKGEDPTAELNRAVQDLGEARRLGLEEGEFLCACGSAHVYRGKARQLRGEDPTEEAKRAIEVLDEALRAEPDFVEARFNRESAWQLIGMARLGSGEDPGEAYARSLADLDAIVEKDARLPEARVRRGLLRATMADLARAREEDPCTWLEKAIEDLDVAVAARPDATDPRFFRATSLLTLATSREAKGQPAEELYERAVADLGEDLLLRPDHILAYRLRGFARASLGEARARRGQDPSAAYVEALADYEAALQRDPAEAATHEKAAAILEWFGRLDEALAALARAKACEGGVGPEGTAALARLEWAAFTRDATAEMARGDYAKARGLYERAVGLAGKEAEEVPSYRPTLAGAHYNLACVHTLLSIGKASPHAAASPIEPDAAASARDAAFEHLGLSLDLAPPDWDHLSADPDLAPLHDDPRWSALLARRKQ